MTSCFLVDVQYHQPEIFTELTPVAEANISGDTLFGLPTYNPIRFS